MARQEIQLCKKKLGHRNQLAFGIMLGYFKRYIKFPSIEENPLPLKLISPTATDLELKPSDIAGFDWSSRTAKRFRQEIRTYLGYREAIDTDAKLYIDYLIEELLPHYPSNELLQEQSRLYFYKKKIEIFKDKQLKRYIASAKHQFEQDFFQRIFEDLSQDNYYLIDQILTETNHQTGVGIIELSELKKDIPGARLKHVNYAIEGVSLDMGRNPTIFR